MLDPLSSPISVAVGATIIAFAFLKGDEPERIGGGAYALGAFASLLLRDGSPLYGPQWGLIIVETIMLTAYAALAWKSRRSWAIWASALQSAVVMSRLLATTGSLPPTAAFYGVISLASYGILLVLALGALRALRDRRALGLE